MQRSLEGGLGVRPEQEQPGEGGRPPPAEKGHVGQTGWVLAQGAAALDHLPADLTGGVEQSAQGTGGGSKQPFAAGAERLGLVEGPGCVGRRVGQGEKDVDQSQTIADGVVQAADERATRPILLDQVELPQRPAHVQGRACQQAGQVLQGRLVALRGQRGLLEMVVDVKVRVVLPIGSAAGGVGNPLSEATEAPQPQFQRRLEPFWVHRGAKDHDAGDHHQVGWILHA